MSQVRLVSDTSDIEDGVDVRNDTVLKLEVGDIKLFQEANKARKTTKTER